MTFCRRAFWMDVRAKQQPGRDFGQAPTAAWRALRKAVPLQTAAQRVKATKADETLAATFVHITDPDSFYPDSPPPQGHPSGGLNAHCKQ